MNILAPTGRFSTQNFKIKEANALNQISWEATKMFTCDHKEATQAAGTGCTLSKHRDVCLVGFFKISTTPKHLEQSGQQILSM